MRDSISLLETMEQRMGSLIDSMHEQNLASKPSRNELKRYTMTKAAKLIGRSYTAIRDAEKAGLLPAPEMGANNRRLGYTLEDINRARDHFGVRLRRNPKTDDCIRLSFSNFKGGSAKTTSAVHAAQYFVQAGLRVLLVDCDPQASATATMGYIPDSDIDEDQTLLPYLEGEESSLEYAIRPTYWPGLDLIPANLQVFSAEYLLAKEASAIALRRLRTGLEGIEEGYDLIILDPSPSLGLISLSVMNAANAIIVPSPAAAYDLYSTRAFLKMLSETLDSLEQLGMEINFKFVRMLITRLDENSEIQSSLAELLPEHLGISVIRNAVRKSAALDRAGMYGRTIYEMNAGDIPRKTLDRALNHFNKVNEEILTLILKSWPSQTAELRDKADI
jgi:chromosome partitioning protein